MARARTVFACAACGHRSPKWLGRCPECGEWSTYSEEVERAEPAAGSPRSLGARAAPGAAPREPARPLDEVRADDAARTPTGISELDRCLGGGLVPGSLVLLGGEPGIGKSTLLLQVSAALARQGRPVLYVSGEESPAQVRLRAGRLALSGESVHVLGETDVDAVLSEIDRLRPILVVVDSIQVMHDAALTSAPGTVSQVRQSADRFLRLAKETGTAVMLIGHVTKEGSLAGPRTLEHVVDTVLGFESEGGQVHRLVRALKNRFGPSGEIGVFEMTGEGLVEVPDASRLFLAERRADTPGSVVFPSMEGTRPVLVELQALVSPTAYAQPKRMTLGVDGNRVAMLLAVLERRAAQHVLDKDVFVNVAGGLRLRETAADLPVALAVVSALLARPLPPDVAAFGEIGLSGEVRSVDRAARRLREVRQLGFERCLVAGAHAETVEAPAGLSLVAVDHLADAVGRLFG
jgi:DNA repair protein RadA/Sms